MSRQLRSLAAVATSTLLCSACSEIVGIEDRSGRWCTVEEASHDFCDDFDGESPLSQWGGQSNAGAEIGDSDRSEPNAFVANSGVVLERAFDQVSTGLLLELDLRVEPAPPKPDLPGHDHALAVLSRSGGSVGLFVGPGGALYFGFMTSILEPLPNLSANASWVRFGISIDAEKTNEEREARLYVDGSLSTVANGPDPGDPENESGAAVTVIIGAQRLDDNAEAVQCSFDNVTVDLGAESP